MCCYLRAISPERLQELLRRPEQVDAVLPYSDDPPADPADALDIDKAWAGIHFLLTGEEYGGEPPLSDVVLGGHPIGDDHGLGPARFLTPAEVGAVAVALDAVSPNQLRERFGDGRSLAEADIYPQIWDEGDDALDYLLSHLTHLVAFYRRAANRGWAVVQFIM